MGRGEEQIVFKVEFVLEKLENKSARDQESERERERERKRDGMTQVKVIDAARSPIWELSWFTHQMFNKTQ